MHVNLLARIAGAWALAAGALAAPVQAQTDALPAFLAAPLNHLQGAGIDTVSIGDRPAVDFFGVDNLDATCPRNQQFMLEAEGVAILTVYYGQAHGIYTGVVDPQEPGPWGIANVLSAPVDLVTAGDLLKTVDDPVIGLAMDLAVAALSDGQAAAIAAAIDGALARYAPVMQALDRDPDLLSAAMAVLVDGVYLSYDSGGPLPETALAELGFTPVGGPCYQHVYYRYLNVGGTTTYTCHVTLDFVYQSFWIRRASEGTHNYTRALLEMAAERLAARTDQSAQDGGLGLKG
jgi:hypothetical protein